MTEFDRAMNDLRKDVIDEVSASLPPKTSASDAVRAIVARLGEGLPALVEVELEVAP